MEYKIYIITNTLNGNQYVGMTSRPITERIGEHFTDARSGKSHPLYEAIRKFGPRMFDYAIVDGCDSRKEATKIEKWWISQLDTFEGEGYNDKPSEIYGYGNPTLSSVQASEIKWLTKNNVEYSEIAKKYPISEASISKINTGTSWKHVDPKPPENANDFFEESYEQTKLK